MHPSLKDEYAPRRIGSAGVLPPVGCPAVCGKAAIKKLTRKEKLELVAIYHGEFSA